MITVKNLFCSYGEREILSGLDLTCADGAVTALLGVNGSGKSTTVGCICGRLPYRGSVSVDGASGKALSKCLAVLPQILPSPAISVRELVLLGRTPHMGFFAHPSRTDREIADNAIERMGLSALADHAVNQLSGGQRQNAFLAMLLAKDAQNLIFDEPSTFMDAASERAFYRFLFTMREQGRCCLVILHTLERALSCADRIVVLDGGVAAFSGDPQSCADSGVLERVFDTRVRRIEIDGKQRWVCLD